MYCIYHMPPRLWWMIGCVAMEINRGPHSPALKENHAVCLDVKLIRQGILWKLNTCHLLPIFFWRYVFISMEMRVSVETDPGRHGLCQLRDGGSGSREPWGQRQLCLGRRHMGATQEEGAMLNWENLGFGPGSNNSSLILTLGRMLWRHVLLVEWNKHWGELTEGGGHAAPVRHMCTKLLPSIWNMARNVNYYHSGYMSKILKLPPSSRLSWQASSFLPAWSSRSNGVADAGTCKGRGRGPWGYRRSSSLVPPGRNPGPGHSFAIFSQQDCALQGRTLGARPRRDPTPLFQPWILLLDLYYIL